MRGRRGLEHISYGPDAPLDQGYQDALWGGAGIFARASMWESWGIPSPTGEDASAFDKDVSYTDDFGQDQTLYRMREGIERFVITDINNAGGSEIVCEHEARMCFGRSGYAILLLLAG